MAQRTHLRHWLRQGQSLGDHTTWAAAPVVDLKQTHARLLQDYQCVEAHALSFCENAIQGAIFALERER